MSQANYVFPTSFPGFGLPVNHQPKNEPLLPNALNAEALALPLLTLQELKMMALMNAITDKEEWFIKIKRREIVEKWRQEALSTPITDDVAITEKMVDWCIAELKYIAENDILDPKNPPPVLVYNGDVYKSDTALSTKFKNSLQEAVLTFESNIPDSEKDWHPRSDEQVLDLVHPSLFSVVYGRTRVLMGDSLLTMDDCIARCGDGVVLRVPDEKQTVDPNEHRGYSNGPKGSYSKDFQWLPCEVDVTENKARVTSYINNLHPVHDKYLYPFVEEIITAAIPLWERTLAPLNPERDEEMVGRRLPYNDVEYSIDADEWPEEDGPRQEIGEDETNFEDRRQEWIEDYRDLVIPEPGTFSQPLARPPPYSLREGFKERGLQVIVKLANIHLTPEKPLYNGGSWHVEGQLNEHIVATALYYYSSSNITTSRLSFRHQVNTDNDDINYAQNHRDWLPTIFGCADEGPGVQEAGSVETREGRLLTFPNVLQHRVDPFRLEDPTKPGHRKIVALFLVDPNLKVLSTAKIPCQRKDWWLDYLKQSETKAGEDKPTFADFPLEMDEAKELRLKLMDERKINDQEQNKGFEYATFALCEH